MRYVPADSDIIPRRELSAPAFERLPSSASCECQRACENMRTEIKA